MKGIFSAKKLGVHLFMKRNQYCKAHPSVHMFMKRNQYHKAHPSERKENSVPQGWVRLMVLVSFHKQMHRRVHLMVLVSFHEHMHRRVRLMVLVSFHK